MFFLYSKFFFYCLQVFDGWELNREIVPGMHDHPLPIQERYTPFCGVGPDKIFVSSQNVALIQYRILAAGEGFKVRVSFKPNPQRMFKIVTINVLFLFIKRSKNYFRGRGWGSDLGSVGNCKQIKFYLCNCNNTVELQWLEYRWLVYHGNFELVLESLGKIP